MGVTVAVYTLTILIKLSRPLGFLGKLCDGKRINNTNTHKTRLWISTDLDGLLNTHLQICKKGSK